MKISKRTVKKINLYILIIKGILLIFLMSMNLSLIAQSDSLKQTTPQKEVVDFRVPSEDKIEKYKNDARFKYYREKIEDPSWLQKLKYWFANLLDKFYNVVGKTMGIPKYIVIGVIVLLLILLILKLAGINYKALLGKKKIDTAEIDIYTENVNEMDFDTLIRNALKNQDYRLATRFLYLKNLKLLSDKEIIKWDINKTNISYLYEINNEKLRNMFLDTSLIFDYVWYGEFSVDQNQYSEISNRMDDFAKTVANER